MVTLDFLIIGQGLAGSLLAWQLIQRQQRVLVIDDGLENASTVAAGLINPITGMRFTKSVDVDNLLPVAKQSYAQLASDMRQDFYIEKDMLRIFNNDKERLNAVKRFTEARYQSYVAQLFTAFKPFTTPFQCLQQRQTGYVLTRSLVTSLKKFLLSQNSYQQHTFDQTELTLGKIVHWRNVQAKRVIFCQGYRASQNPYFNWLPFQPVKGEILTLNHQHALPNLIINYGHWLLPLTNQQVRLGATFDWQNVNAIPTEQGKNSLFVSVKTIFSDFQAELVEHQAHVRPCTLDKQPFIGFHPAYQQLAIFNGFGAKGSLQIPYYAQQFAEALINGSAITESCDIKRYYSRYVAA